eukprot:TRINITY_DN5429_c0_g1_i1.p1 TRINITY_DN5429_c0_g1~~TRINITY_DN5429_c0_g1_i1.p1  ORF type:complete len:174 (+),score=46.01 TRINITY_DN5429_c0_g1_i1:71-592(+)
MSHHVKTYSHTGYEESRKNRLKRVPKKCFLCSERGHTVNKCKNGCKYCFFNNSEEYLHQNTECQFYCQICKKHHIVPAYKCRKRCVARCTDLHSERDCPVGYYLVTMNVDEKLVKPVNKKVQEEPEYFIIDNSIYEEEFPTLGPSKSSNSSTPSKKNFKKKFKQSLSFSPLIN